MKKKIIILLLLVPFISILIVIVFRGFFTPTNEEIIESLKNIKYYSCDTEYIIKNYKAEQTESTYQWYSKKDGVRVEFDEEIKLYKNDGIHVINKESNKEYVMSVDMDVLHSLAFMNNILSYDIDYDTIVEAQEEWGDTIYIKANIDLDLNNMYLDKAIIYIDKKLQAPIGIVIYDEDGNDTVRIIYKNFKELKSLDENLI